MLIKFIFLFTISIIAVQAKPDLSTIIDDATAWTELQRRYMNRSPYAPFLGIMKANCNIMLECCPSQRGRFFDLIRLDKFEETCFGNRSSTLSNSSLAKCDFSIHKLYTIKRSDDNAKFMTIYENIPGDDERYAKWEEQMSKVCSGDELEAQYCDPTDLDQFRSCQEKVLKMVAEKNNEDDYRAYVNEVRDNYHIYLERLAKLFPDLVM